MLSVTGLVITGGQWTPCLLAVQASPPLSGTRLQGQVTLQMVFQMTLQTLAWGRPASEGLGQHAGVDLCVRPQVVFLCLLWAPLLTVSVYGV